MTFWCFEFTPQKFINFSWEVAFVWEGDKWDKSEEGFCRKQKASLVLEEFFCHPGANTQSFAEIGIFNL